VFGTCQAQLCNNRCERIGDGNLGPWLHAHPAVFPQRCKQQLPRPCAAVPPHCPAHLTPSTVPLSPRGVLTSSLCCNMCSSKWRGGSWAGVCPWR
jgi:hypothetical protein